jgi:hypothetical protein
MQLRITYQMWDNVKIPHGTEGIRNFPEIKIGAYLLQMGLRESL